MKIERPWLRLIVSAIVGGLAGFAIWMVGKTVLHWGRPPGPPTPAWWWTFFQSIFFTGPIIAAVLAHMLTPKKTLCRKCGYILKGLTEPRCSECGEKI